ncbi:MAG: GrpB family protein, partial [bacterium]
PGRIVAAPTVFRRMMAPVVIHAYDPRWPRMFDEERTAIFGAIGDTAAAVEHIGSTAIPGLGAKPIIDIMVGVRRLADADRCSRNMRE